MGALLIIIRPCLTDRRGSLKQPNNEGLRKFIEKFYIEKKKVNLALELGAPDYQSDCSTTQATVPHTDHS